MSDVGASYHDDLDEIEHICGVNIDVSDETGSTYVYTYTLDGERLGFEFYSMNPMVEDVIVVTQAIDSLRKLLDRRPRVGSFS